MEQLNIVRGDMEVEVGMAKKSSSRGVSDLIRGGRKVITPRPNDEFLSGNVQSDTHRGVRDRGPTM